MQIVIRYINNDVIDCMHFPLSYGIFQAVRHLTRQGYFVLSVDIVNSLYSYSGYDPDEYLYREVD